MFVDGSLVMVATDIFSQTDPTGTSVNLGGSFNSQLAVGRAAVNEVLTARFRPWNGYIDDFRYTVGEAIYWVDFTPPTSAHPAP